jgi:hypothetical protein
VRQDISLEGTTAIQAEQGESVGVEMAGAFARRGRDFSGHAARNKPVRHRDCRDHAGESQCLLRGGKLPFDIASYRVVFYDDSIGGKSRVEEDLARHLDAIGQSAG